MSAPIPSFFKMRLIIAIVLIMLGFLFIGLINRAFAGCEGDQGDGTCVAYLWQNLWTGSTGGEACYGQRPDSIFLDSSCVPDKTSSELCAPFDNARYEVKRYLYSSGAWSHTGTWLFYYSSTRAEPDFGSEGTEADLPEDCCDLQAKEECGDLPINWIDRSSCQYTCGCEVDPPAEEVCYSSENVVWQEDCQYSCKCFNYTGQQYFDFESCEEGTDPCEGQQSPADVCDGYQNVIWDDQANCEYHCGEPCEDSDGDGTKDPCDDCPNNPEITKNQIHYFVGVGGACEEKGYDIGDDCGYVNVDCSSGDTTISPAAGMSVSDFQDCCTSDSSNDDNCSVDENCEKDSDGDGIPDSEDDDDDNDGIPDSEDDDDDGDGIPDDQELGNDPDSDGDGIPDSEDDDDDNDGIPDWEDDDDDGDGIPDVDEVIDPSNPGAFNIPFMDTVVERFTARFSLFIERMKQTSLFSLPNKLSGSGLSGGTSVLQINGGQTYGIQEVDFGDWSGGLVVFRAVIYITSVFVAVRIVTLKR